MLRVEQTYIRYHNMRDNHYFITYRTKKMKTVRSNSYISKMLT